MAVSQHFITWTCSDRLYALYLYYWLQRLKPVMSAVAMGSTIKTIGMKFFQELEIPLPDYERQIQIADSLKLMDLELNELSCSSIAVSELQKAISVDPRITIN